MCPTWGLTDRVREWGSVCGGSDCTFSKGAAAAHLWVWLRHAHQPILSPTPLGLRLPDSRCLGHNPLALCHTKPDTGKPEISPVAQHCLKSFKPLDPKPAPLLALPGPVPLMKPTAKALLTSPLTPCASWLTLLRVWVPPPRGDCEPLSLFPMAILSSSVGLAVSEWKQNPTWTFRCKSQSCV